MEKFLSLIPFLMLKSDGNGGQKRALNYVRIFEAVVIAIIGGAFAGYIAVTQMKVEVVHIKEDICEIKTEIKGCNDKLLHHIENYHTR